MTLTRIIKHQWLEDEIGYHCSKCGKERTFNPNIDYTGGNCPFPLTGYDYMNFNEACPFPLTGYDYMNFNEALYGDCIE